MLASGSCYYKFPVPFIEVDNMLNVHSSRSEVAKVIVLKADTPSQSRGGRICRGIVLTDLQVGKQLYESSLIHVDCLKGKQIKWAVAGYVVA